jgi:hypothetical protein
MRHSTQCTCPCRHIPVRRQGAPWTLLIVLAVAAFAQAGPGDAPPAEVVRARRIEVVDAQGRVRAALSVGEGDGPRLMYYDVQGRHRLALALHADVGPGLELFTAAGGHAVQVRHINGEASIGLHDAEGFERLRLNVPGVPAPEPHVSVLARDQTIVTSWPAKTPADAK